MNKINISRIKLMDGKQQIINLESSLLFVYGTTATGKTLLAELISYGLGKKKLQIIEELKPFEKILLEINTSTGQFVICRDLKKQSASILVLEGKIEDFSENTATRLQLAGGTPDTQFSWFLLEKAGIPAVKSVPESVSLSSRPALVSFRDIFQFCYLSQVRIDSDLPFGLHPSFELPKAIDALEVMLNIKSIELYDKDMERFYITQRRKNLIPKIEYLKSFLKSYDIESKSDIQNLIEKGAKKLSEIKARIASFNFSNKVISDKADSRLLEEISKVESLISDQTNRKLSLIATLEKWEKLLNSYRLEQNRLTVTARANELISDIEFKICPCCGKKIKNSDDKKCVLCSQKREYLEEDDKTIQIQIKELMIKQEELFNKIQNLKDHISGISTEIISQTNNLKSIKEKYVNSREIKVDPKVNEYHDLCIEAGRIESEITYNNKLIGMFGRLESLQSDHDKLAEDEKIISDEIETIKEKSEERKNSVIEILTKNLSELISKLPIPEVYKKNISIDRDKYLPLIDGELYLKVSSGGLKVYFMTAYFIALLETAFEYKDNYHPRLVIIDSIHKNISTKDSTDKTSVEIFFRKICEISDKHPEIQILIMDNELPEFIETDDKFKKWHFTRDNGHSNGLIK